jgi:hypothetical protein
MKEFQDILHSSNHQIIIEKQETILNLSILIPTQSQTTTTTLRKKIK